MIPENLTPLTEAERIDARERAARYVVASKGREPARAHFTQHAASRYPGYVTATVTGIMLTLIVAFFSLSAMRLYSIGSRTFADTIPAPLPSAIAGVAIVIGSEAGALGFLLAAGVLAGDHRSERRILTALSFASVSIALVGNMQFALGSRWYSMILTNPFAFLEAVLPPVVVLGSALVFKRLWLDDIARRHANERAFQEARAAWREATAEPESDPAHRQYYATALREVFFEKHKRKSGIKDLSRAQWRQIVLREMAADHWFSGPAIDEPPPQEEDTQETNPTQPAPVLD